MGNKTGAPGQNVINFAASVAAGGRKITAVFDGTPLGCLSCQAIRLKTPTRLNFHDTAELVWFHHVA